MFLVNIDIPYDKLYLIWIRVCSFRALLNLIEDYKKWIYLVLIKFIFEEMSITENILYIQHVVCN